jgi:hypothetical protein
MSAVAFDARGYLRLSSINQEGEGNNMESNSLTIQEYILAWLYTLFFGLSPEVQMYHDTRPDLWQEGRVDIWWCQMVNDNTSQWVTGREALATREASRDAEGRLHRICLLTCPNCGTIEALLSPDSLELSCDATVSV